MEEGQKVPSTISRLNSSPTDELILQKKDTIFGVKCQMPLRCKRCSYTVWLMSGKTRRIKQRNTWNSGYRSENCVRLEANKEQELK